MNKSILAMAMAVATTVGMAQPAAAQSSMSGATGGAGGTGGAAAGGNATGGTAAGGTAQGGAGGSANAGASTSTAQGGSVGTVSTGGSQASLGDVTVNYIQPSGALGKDGLGAGVDPTTGHIVTDNKIQYSGSYKVKNTPDIGIGGPASGPCNGFSASFGFSVAGFGIGGNTSTVDEGCTARETARIAAMLGRMDIANAVLENLPAVQTALKAKAEREAGARPSAEAPAPAPVPAVTTPLPEDPRIQAAREAALKAVRDLDQVVREVALKEQQNQAQQALLRQATMAKVNDTLKFTDATNQANEKTPQEIMAEEATRKQNQSVQQFVPKEQEGQQLPATTSQGQQLPATTSASPPQAQISAPALRMTGLKSETSKSQVHAEGKGAERTPPASPDDTVQAAKAAMNLL